MDIRKEYNAAIKKALRVSEALAPTAARFHAFFVANAYAPSMNLSIHDYTGYAPEFDEYSLEFLNDDDLQGYAYSFVLPLNDGAEDMRFVVPFDYIDDPDAWEASYLEARMKEQGIAEKALLPTFPEWAATAPKGIQTASIPERYLDGIAEEGEFIYARWNISERSVVRYDFLIRASDNAVFLGGPLMLAAVVSGKVSPAGQ